MSVNKYDSTTGTLTTLATGDRTWVGTKAAYDAQKQAGTLPNDCLIVITDDEVEMDTVPTEDSPVAVTSDGIYKTLYNVEQEQLGTNINIVRCGKLRTLTVSGFACSTNQGSFNGLSGKLPQKDLPKINALSDGLATFNGRYYPLHIILSTTGNFSGYGLDVTTSGGYVYLTGTPTLYFTFTYIVN